ncbi:MAG: hydrogenase 4 subunit B [Deltaproteobacteria bacterium]|nr:hydrogenase 4 subunit B [Deltaproteobacteria bacterium]
MQNSPLELSLLSVILFLITAAIAPMLSSRQGLLIKLSFTFSSVSAFIAAMSGFMSVSAGTVDRITLLIGLPDLPFYLRLDPLSGFFAAIISLLGFFISIYSIGYVRAFIGHRSVTPLVVFYNLFMAGMLLVLLSDDAYFFMVSWELMAVSSFFLVCFEDDHAQNRRAGFLYLIMAHIGAVLILLSFGLMAGFANGFENFSGYTFSAMRYSHMPDVWATVAFLLAFFGFAMKAGVFPLHAWLPEAHPVAPSNVSALMSGVMLKTAIYGIIRVAFDLLHVSDWWWGGIVLIFGLISAVMGVLYALMQNDLKRLLAYSSVENIGLILVSIGLAMIFKSFNMGVLASLALMAALYHSFNHAMFKGLLFMGAGAVLHSTHQRNMESMGGLIHKMKWTAPLMLLGCLAASGLPPLNGFVSEWLTFQSFLLSPALPSSLLNLLIPLGAALVALTGALAARCYIKVYGVTFLGRWRGEHNTVIQEAGWAMRLGMIMAALACLALGVFPTFVIGWMDVIPEMLVEAKISTSANASGWLWLTPVAAERASYSAPLVFLGVLAIILAIYKAFRSKSMPVRRVPAWDCGLGGLTNRMQYSSTSFSMPTRRIYGFLFNIKETVKYGVNPYLPMFNNKFIYHLKIRDRIWHIFYKPFADASFWIARRVSRLQHGRIQIYLLYSFITLIILLVFA